MISNIGHIIHIDYGYILENPIHSTILNHPVIRISNEMIDFLGGVNGDYYQLFKQYIINVELSPKLSMMNRVKLTYVNPNRNQFFNENIKMV